MNVSHLAYHLILLLASACPGGTWSAATVENPSDAPAADVVCLPPAARQHRTRLERADAPAPAGPAGWVGSPPVDARAPHARRASTPYSASLLYVLMSLQR